MPKMNDLTAKPRGWLVALTPEQINNLMIYGGCWLHRVPRELWIERREDGRSIAMGIVCPECRDAKKT